MPTSGQSSLYQYNFHIDVYFLYVKFWTPMKCQIHYNSRISTLFWICINIGSTSCIQFLHLRSFLSLFFVEVNDEGNCIWEAFIIFRSWNHCIHFYIALIMWETNDFECPCSLLEKEKDGVVLWSFCANDFFSSWYILPLSFHFSLLHLHHGGNFCFSRSIAAVLLLVLNVYSGSNGTV